jgi:hypothetical protein
VLAAVLLDNFLFYSERASDRLLVAAYRRLEDDVLLGRLPIQGDRQQFLDSLVFTPVEGEVPRPTDSGNPICRKLRDLVGIPDERFLQPQDALAEARAGRPVAFVDDFIGSGSQLAETWVRAYSAGTSQSFEEAHQTRSFSAFCLAMTATEVALANLRTRAPPVVVIAAHVLDASYSVQELNAPQLAPPIPDFQKQLGDFLARHAILLDLEPFLQKGSGPLYGYHGLGLLLSFEHATPDSTIPLLWANGSGSWIQLVKYR